jgi:hypothetical protein
MKELVKRLLKSDEPSVRWLALTRVLGKGPRAAEVKRAQEEIRKSERVRALLREQQVGGRIPHHPYDKWCGAHWVLAALAELGYPPGDRDLEPLRDQVYEWLLSPQHENHIRVVAGRVRRCASQEGNALWATLTLGLADGRADELAARLVKWQWADGGWNCDKRRQAKKSSFHESHMALRALALYGRRTGDRKAKAAARKAAEVFLRRRLFRRLKNGAVMDEEFTRLHYPPYWHYDVLVGLKTLAAAGFVRDKRCREALDLVAGKGLADGGWPAEKKYYTVEGPDRRAAIPSGRSLVSWGPTGKTLMNEWVTADVLYVMREAGRLK